jgi:tetratricopeptide (TPR) repeat protein
MTSLEASGPSLSLAELYEAIAWLFSHNGQPDQALQAVEQAIATWRALRDRPNTAYAGHGLFLLHANRADEALQAQEDAVRLVEGVGDLGTLAWALSHLAWIHEERGEYEQDRRSAERAFALAEQVRNASCSIFSMMRLGVSAFFTGDWPRAGTWFERAMALTDQVGLVQGQDYAVPRLELGRLRLAEGAWEEGSRYLEASLAPYAESSNVTMRRVAQGQLAERDVLAGNPAAACARLIPELDRPRLEERMVTQYILPVLAWAQLEAGEVEQAGATVADAVRRGRTGHCRLGLVRALRVQALVLLARERWDEAEQSLEEGLELARSMPYPHGEGRLLQVYGQLHSRKGELVQARERLEAAVAIFRRLGACKDVEWAERDLAALAGGAASRSTAS